MPYEKPYEKPADEIGALWAKQGGNGEFLSGEINGLPVVCFRVRSSSPKAPTWRVLKSKPREERQSARPDNETDFI